MKYIGKLNKFNMLSKIKIPSSFTAEPFNYSILKIIPYKKGYSADDFEKIINTLSKYNKTFFGRLEMRGKCLIYRPKQPLCFEVLFTKDKISYFFAIPDIYKNIFINKIKFLLINCEIEEVDDYIYDFRYGIKQKLRFKKNSAFAINTNSSINISDSLIVLNKDLHDNEKILLQYMFQPLFEYEWKDKFNKNIQKNKETGLLQTDFSLLKIIDFVDMISDMIVGQIDMVLNALMMVIGGEELINIEKEKQNFISELSESTKKKTLYDGFKTNINLYLKTNSDTVTENISRNVSTIFQDLDSDNSIVIAKSKIIKKDKQLKRQIRSAFTMNTLECRQLVRTPSEPYMDKYEDLLDKVNIEELAIPDELLKGRGILLGELMRGNVYRQITFGEHGSSLSKPLVYISETEGGKSSFLRMYGISALEQGHSVFAFDTIDGKTIEIIRDHLPKNFPEEKIVILDFKNREYIFSLLWNEVSDIYIEQLNKANDKLKKYQLMEEFSNTVGNELKRFIDIFQEEDRQNRLTPAMRTTLSQIAQLVFMNSGNFGMVKDCLHDIKLRHKLLDNLNLPQHLPFVQSILKLDSEGYSQTIKGIESRLNLIIENETLKKYFSASSNSKLDFTKWANNGYCVLINIPEEFSDVLVTFLVQKLWLAIKSSRYSIEENDRPHTHLLIDEPNRFPTIMDLLTDHLIASRKWHLRFLFFIHNMSIFRNAMGNLKSAGVSFIMLPTNQWNFSQVAEFYEPYKYDALKEVERLIAKCNGKFRYALCSIHYKSANYPMVIKLPLPVEVRYKKIDRSYLNEQCAKKYGTSQIEYYQTLFDKCEDSNMEIDKDKVAI